MRCSIPSNVKMQALTYIDWIGCLGNELRPELALYLHSPEAVRLRVEAGPLDTASLHQGFSK